MNTDWLEELAPEHAPAPPSWWPLATGWWLLAVGVLLSMAVLWWAWRRYQRLAPRRAALAELARIRATHVSDLASDSSCVAMASAVQRLLRRYALTVLGLESVARASGSAWLELLVKHGGTGFAGAAGQAFLAAVYGERNAAAAVRDGWLTAAESFLRKAHRRAQRQRSAEVAT